MKINFTLKPCVEPELLRSYVVKAKARGLPTLSVKERPSLAIVGGGPSVIDHLDTLRAWPGDIWGCSSAFQWLRAQGIAATFFNVDPLPETVDLARGAKHAILSTTNYPPVFDVVQAVETFNLEDHVVGVTSACTAPHVALHMGYRDFTFFGCDSSFERVTHINKSEHEWEAVIFVKVGAETFPTKPQLLIQAKMIAPLIRMAPDVFRERCGGLLRALVANPEYDITHWNKAMQDLCAGKSQWMIHGDYGMELVRSPQERYESMQRGFVPCDAPINQLENV